MKVRTDVITRAQAPSMRRASRLLLSAVSFSVRFASAACYRNLISGIPGSVAESRSGQGLVLTPSSGGFLTSRSTGGAARFLRARKRKRVTQAPVNASVRGSGTGGTGGASETVNEALLVSARRSGRARVTSKAGRQTVREFLRTRFGIVTAAPEFWRRENWTADRADLQEFLKVLREARSPS